MYGGNCGNAGYSNKKITLWASKGPDMGAMAENIKCCDRIRCNGTGVQ